MNSKSRKVADLGEVEELPLSSTDGVRRASKQPDVKENAQGHIVDKNFMCTKCGTDHPAFDMPCVPRK